MFESYRSRFKGDSSFYKNVFKINVYHILLRFRNIKILLMFLVGFMVQKKCNSKFHVFKRFDSDWSPHQ